MPGPPRDGERTLSFEQRLLAQRAIERVYHSGRMGTARPFEEAVPRHLLDRKVRTYLSQSVALARLWRSPISAGALRRELERIAANTRFPERLRAIYEALGNDTFLIQETFVRAALADRLARGHFSGAPAGVPRQDWETCWEEARREFDPALAHEVAESLHRLPEPGPRADDGPGPTLDATPADVDVAASPCELQDIWGAGETSVPPAPRSGHTAVWTGSEMIVWGGSDLDTGALYDPLTDAWRPMPQAGAPAGRTDHTAVWTGSEMIVWGGFGPGTILTTGGRYDPVSNAWTATSLVDAPSKRYGHTAVWTGQEMIVWGGWAGGGARLNTGGRYDPESDTWSATSLVDAPILGFYHTAVWTGSEMIVWGGDLTSAGGVYNPATDTWRQTSLLDAPRPRRLATAVWTGTEMIVWGGSSGGYAPGGGRYNPATDTWRPTNPGSAPLNRYYHTAVWTGSRMIVWGGYDFSGPPPSEAFNTGALYDPVADAWTPTSLDGAPAPRGRHSAVWADGRMIVWGGRGDSSGGRYDPSTDSWTPTNATPSSPSQRAAHTAVWTGSEMIVWGGTTDSSGGRYDPLLDAWTPTALANAPSPRFYHTAVWTGQEMVVWGGEDAGGPLDTGGRYDPASDTWSPTSLAGAPAPRAYHTAVWTGRDMIVWGGEVGDYQSTNTGGRYDPASDTWSPASLAGAPSPRAYHTAVWTGRAMIVWGGDEGGYLGTNTGGRYDPALDTWSPTSPLNAPSARAYHTAVWTGSGMIVWGGYGGAALDTGGRYDPLADSWTPTTTAGAPFGRLWHTAVWTGREMIVWGGAYESGFYVYSTNSGGRYDPDADAWAPTTTTGAPEERDLHTAVWIGTAMIVRGGEQYTGDLVYLARDPQVAWYGAAAAVPSPDSDRDGFSVCAADCDDADAAVYPGAPQFCGDGRNNDCSDPAWPSLAGTNEMDDDADGVSECAGDCDDANGAVQGTPAEVTGLEVQGSDPALLTWNPPAGGGAERYDTLRSAAPGDFLAGATCVESDDPSDTSASDAGLPAVGEGFFYLVRAENSCPGVLGTGPLGFSSSGVPLLGRACP
ncbi:MAG: hypothetical protein HYS34_06540 [Acidobacteria bacterium]|nr:hypothetical protein [Acidobacteriota bacterium]